MLRANNPDQKPNPLDELIADHQRSARNRRIADKLKSELPILIDDQVAEQVHRLEDKLLRNFTQLRKDALEKSTAALNAELNERISILEHASSEQARTVGKLRESLEITEYKLGSVANFIETTLADSAQVDDHKGSPGLCPKCMAPQIRRSHRRGLWDEVVRIFLMAPYRCTRCRHKFYRSKNPRH
jgi:hypothetical protein